jgi:SAM-dependent methyltransferase
MGFVGGWFADAVLSFFKWEDMTGEYYAGKSKLELVLGPGIWKQVEGKSVIDFGCGDGAEAVEVAQRGSARRVIGLDINSNLLNRARERARLAGVEDRIEFASSYEGHVDLIYALDSFEHFQDPAYILDVISELIGPDGKCLVSFGPPWYHPLGSHCLIFPWAHVILTEASIMKWRNKYKQDGNMRYSDGSGGVNQMTIRKFIDFVSASKMEFEKLELVPIRKLAWAHNRLTREFTTAVVRCVLRKRQS